MLLSLSLTMSYTGFTGLSLSMQRHQRDVLGRTLSAHWNTVLRITGYVLLFLTYLLCALQSGPSVGVLLWVGVLSAGAILLVAMLASKARLLLVSAPAALIAAILLQGLIG